MVQYIIYFTASFRSYAFIDSFISCSNYYLAGFYKESPNCHSIQTNEKNEKLFNENSKSVRNMKQFALKAEILTLSF